MSKPIIRRSLIVDVSNALRDSIQRGDYVDVLPSERRLSEEIGVSRPTIRFALEILEYEGLLKRDGQRNRCIQYTAPRTSVKNPKLVVRLLQNNTHANFLNEHLRIQEFLSQRLSELRKSEMEQDAGEFHIEVSASCYSSQPEIALERITRVHPADVWILYLATEKIQKWFQEKKLKCIVLGSCFDGIDLPSVDENYTATSQHAAGLFLSKGHTQLALIASQFRHPGDVASKEGFRSGFSHRKKHEKIHFYEGLHDGTTDGICKTVDWLLNRSVRPTGWFILSPQVYLTVSSYLASKGILIGKDISLICRNSDPYIDMLIPSVAHYVRKVDRMSRRLLDMIIQISNGRLLKNQRSLFTSEFRNGNSLNRP